MLVFILRRILSSVPTLLGVLTLVFFLIRIVPGDPALAILGDSASEQALLAFRERMGLNVPLWEQYIDFIWQILQGDLGNSMVTGESVLASVIHVLPDTLELAAAAIIFGTILGIPLGILAALNRNTWIDYICRFISLVGLSFPAFLTAILAILWLAIEIPIFPVISNTDGSFSDRMYNLFLPATSMGLIMVAYVMRTTRSSMLEVLGEDYIRTARAKGTPIYLIVMRHAFKNALIPIITVVGLYMGLLVGNAVLTEIVFNRSGLGKLIILSLNQRDYVMLQGLMVVYAFIVVIINLITDITYGVFDPRVKYS